jgi:hypothetical protein
MKLRIFLKYAIICSFLTGIQCTAKKGSPTTALPTNLQLGISLESAKRLTSDAGWFLDTTMVFGDQLSVLVFRNVYIQNIKNPFEITLNFRNGALASFDLIERPNSFSGSAQPTHSMKDCIELLAIIRPLHGRPSDSGISISYPDSVLYMYWRDTTSSSHKLYSLYFNKVKGDLIYSAAHVRTLSELEKNLSK